MLVDDETQGAQIVVMGDGKLVAGDFIRLIYNSQDGELLELDAEAVAYADGRYYVVGSHGRPRHSDDPGEERKNNARAQATRQIFRIRFDPAAVTESGRLFGAAEINPSTMLSKLIGKDVQLAPSFDRPLKENGLTIEGLAVHQGRLYVGMRAPLLPGRKAAVLSTPVATVFDGQVPDTRVHTLDLDGRGIRDLAIVEDRFLVLAGPVQDPDDDKVKSDDYRIYLWDVRSGSCERLSSLPAYGDKVKPEALLPIRLKNGRLSLLLMFDGPSEGEPRPIEIDWH